MADDLNRSPGKLELSDPRLHQAYPRHLCVLWQGTVILSPSQPSNLWGLLPFCHWLLRVR